MHLREAGFEVGEVDADPRLGAPREFPPLDLTV